MIDWLALCPGIAKIVGVHRYFSFTGLWPLLADGLGPRNYMTQLRTGRLQGN